MVMQDSWTITTNILNKYNFTFSSMTVFLLATFRDLNLTEAQSHSDRGVVVRIRYFGMSYWFQRNCYTSCAHHSTPKIAKNSPSSH